MTRPRILRNLPALALAALTFAPAAHAETLLSITGFGPEGNSDPQAYLGTSSAGTLATITESPALSPAVSGSTVTSTVYSFSVSDLTVDGDPGHTLTWDITLTAGATVGSPTLGIDGGPNRGWVVHSTAPGSNIYLNPNENLNFVVSNLLLDGGAGASFTGFTGLTSDVGTADGTASPDTYDVTTAAASSRLRSVSFGFSVTSAEA
jgi:hypothetical protein